MEIITIYNKFLLDLINVQLKYPISIIQEYLIVLFFIFG